MKKPSIAQQADQPDLIFDFSDANALAGDHYTNKDEKAVEMLLNKTESRSRRLCRRSRPWPRGPSGSWRVSVRRSGASLCPSRLPAQRAE